MVTLRPISLNDAEQFSGTASRAFIEAYFETETMAELESFCAKHFSMGQVTADLQNIDFQHVAAFWGEKMVGYLKVNLAVLPDGSRDSSAMQIHRIYVLREFWAHKIGAALLLKSMEMARHFGSSRIWLVVYNKNVRAQDFYKKWGFRQTGTYDFDFNGTVHQDHLLELELPPGP